MKINFTATVILITAILLILNPSISSANEYTTFASFYKDSSVIYWGLAAVAALIGGAAIYLSLGTASPMVVSMGTWVGTMMGYSGIAATNAGLALLGGGSLASGGFGMVGGAALLTAALTFSAGTAVNYSVNAAINNHAYDYSEFAEKSKGLITLPLPKNTSGPASYKAAFESLKDVREKELLSSNFNQGAIKDAIKALQLTKDDDITKGDLARSNSMLALLQFLNNDYASAKLTSNKAYGYAKDAELIGSLPAFIYGTSLLYDRTVKFDISSKFFKWSIGSERDNPLTPYMFAIYLDRLMYRLNDTSLPTQTLGEIYSFSKSLNYDERKSVIQLGILNRDFARLYIEQYKINALTKYGNRNSQAALNEAKASLLRYKSLLSITQSAWNDQSSILGNRFNSEVTLTDRLTLHGIKEWEKNWNNEIIQRGKLLNQYSNIVDVLAKRVAELESSQTCGFLC